MKNLFFSLFLPLRPFEIFFFFFQPSEPRRKEDFKQPQIQKKTEQVDSEGYNEIKEVALCRSWIAYLVSSQRPARRVKKCDIVYSALELTLSSLILSLNSG